MILSCYNIGNTINHVKFTYMWQSIQEWSKNCGIVFWSNLVCFNRAIWSVLTDHVTSNFLKAAFHKFYLVHIWILSSMCKLQNLDPKIISFLKKLYWKYRTKLRIRPVFKALMIDIARSKLCRLLKQWPKIPHKSFSQKWHYQSTYYIMKQSYIQNRSK